jgi:hypothetical protein
MLFLNDNHILSRLGNVYTGEGKTLITVMLATCLAPVGNRVKVVTSSKVLMERNFKQRKPDSKEENQRFFALFAVACSNNCDEACTYTGRRPTSRTTSC